MRKKPKYMKKSVKWVVAKKRMAFFFRRALDWLPLWTSPVLALAAWVSLASGNIVIMAGAVACFFCAVISSVLLVQAVRVDAPYRIRKLDRHGSKPKAQGAEAQSRKAS